MTDIVPVLLAGGSGSRLWPTSRQSYPKQFSDLTGGGCSLLQSSLKRVEGINGTRPWIVVTGDDYRFLVAQQMAESGYQKATILLEPAPRNTAPAVAIAALEAQSLYTDPFLLIQTADHLVRDVEAFAMAVADAAAAESPFILFGVEPTRPETGYGYIECGDKDHRTHHVASFKEKPNIETAKQYLAAGNFLWNSGMFLINARAYLEVLERLEPELLRACVAAHERAQDDLDFKRIDRASFEASPSISIDYAVMEKLDDLRVVPYSGDWSDVGAWDVVADVGAPDSEGNTIDGDGIVLNSRDSYIRAESRLVAGIGLNNLLVIETRDAVLVADRNSAQDVKQLVETLKDMGRPEATMHQKVYRPWGSYETLALGSRFQVKKITVNPAASLSLQMHHHRAEHWIVVSGTAEVEVGEKSQIMIEDESVYIPIGSKHRLTNPGKLPLILIEVQSGGYLGEDDIVRFDDVYGRVEGDDAKDRSIESK